MIKHFCVSVYVFNPKSKNFLMVNHKKLGKWVQPGGHIELNEDPEEASLREVFEETGIKVKLIGKRYPREEDYITPIAIQKNIVKENHIHIDFVYLAYPLENQVEVQNVEETDGLEWFTLEEILDDNFDTFENVRTICKKIFDDHKA